MPICMISLGKKIVYSFTVPTFNWIFLLLNFMSSLYTSDINPLSAEWLQIFSPIQQIASIFCWWLPLPYRFLVLVWYSPTFFFFNCFCCFYFWCQIPKGISKTDVKELSACVFFWKFYGFRWNLFLSIHICLLFCFRSFLPLFTYTTCVSEIYICCCSLVPPRP